MAGPRILVVRLGAMGDVIHTLPAVATRVDWIDAPWLDISAHDIRRRVREKLSIRYLVPRAVESFIAEQGLYSLHRK